MPLLAIFSRKDKSKANSSKDTSSNSNSSTSGHDSLGGDYVWSPAAVSVPTVHNDGYRYSHSNDSQVSSHSASKIRLIFKKKHSSSPLIRPLSPLYDGHDPSTVTNTNLTDRTNQHPSARHPVFPSFHDNGGVSSTRSLPADALRRPPITPLQKIDSSAPSTQSSSKSSGGGLFSWVSRDRTKSKPSEPPALQPLPDNLESFNLKSFRHVQLSDSPSSTPGQNDALLPPARPRGSSMVPTDSAQRISVGQFRAQARRSSTNVASTSNSPSARPISLADSQFNSDKDLPPPRPPRASRPSASPSPVRQSRVSSSAVETSDESSSEQESDSEELAPSRSRRLSRDRTITPRSRVSRSDAGHGNMTTSHHRQTTSTRSELGHGSPVRGSPARGPPPSSFQKTTPPPPVPTGGTRSFSMYRRQQASFSTSELSSSAAAQRASVIAAAKAQLSASGAANRRPTRSDSDTSESSSDSESEDDAPLSTFLNPSRPGSSMSQSTATTSTARPGQNRAKPLIDLKSECNPITGKPSPSSSSRDERTPSYLSPTNINDRLSQLATGISSSASSPTSVTHTPKGLNTSFTRSDISAVGNTRERSGSSSSMSTPDNRFKATEQRNTPSPRFTDKPLTASPTKTAHSPLHDTTHEAASNLSSSTTSKTDEAKVIPIRGRPENSDRGFKVISRPQRMHTSPSMSSASASESNNGSGSNVSTQAPRLESHRRLSSSFEVTSRPTSIPSIKPEPTRGQSDRSSSVPAPTPRSIPVSQPPPSRPFANVKRRDSPSSSTGGSSNGKAPLTPMDGSDYFTPEVAGGSEESPGNSSAGGVTSAMKGARRHVKRASVTFQEPESTSREFEKAKARSASHGAIPRPVITPNDEELKRRERRRSEAKAAIELGNVINGRGPVDDDDDEDADSDVPVGGTRKRVSSLNPMGGANMMSYAGTNPLAGGTPWQGMQTPGMPGMLNMGVNPSQFFMQPNPASADPSFIAAHQQAMMAAKRAYQMAVAQQAMAAAGDEWERSSNAGGFAGMGGMSGMSGMGGVNMGMGWMQPMFPMGTQSVYAGSSIGGASNIGVGWGSASVYGETFGPATVTRRGQNAPSMNFPSGDKRMSSTNNVKSFPRSESHGNLSSMHPSSRASAVSGSANSNHNASKTAPRQRTKTAPSNSQLPVQHARYGGRSSPVPPSSWKTGY